MSKEITKETPIRCATSMFTQNVFYSKLKLQAHDNTLRLQNQSYQGPTVMTGNSSFPIQKPFRSTLRKVKQKLKISKE